MGLKRCEQNDDMTNKSSDSVLRTVDEAAIRLAGSLIHTARHASLATLEPESGFPLVTRVLVAVADGQLVLLLSELSAHTQALLQDPRCSILCGEPGAGDPMAQPRVTTSGIAFRLKHKDPRRLRIRALFLEQHPKAGLYADFGDFAFWAITPTRASLNAGFGRAYLLTADQVATALAGAPTGL